MCKVHRRLEGQGSGELTSFQRLITMRTGQCSRYTRCGLFPALQDIFISCLLGRLLKGMLVASYLLVKHRFNLCGSGKGKCNTKLGGIL